MYKVIIWSLFIFIPIYCSVFCHNSFGSDGISTAAHVLTTTVSPENCKARSLETLQVSFRVSFCISSSYGNLWNTELKHKFVLLELQFILYKMTVLKMSQM